MGHLISLGCANSRDVVIAVNLFFPLLSFFSGYTCRAVASFFVKFLRLMLQHRVVTGLVAFFFLLWGGSGARGRGAVAEVPGVVAAEKETFSWNWVWYRGGGTHGN